MKLVDFKPRVKKVKKLWMITEQSGASKAEVIDVGR